jgi:hypothetical protein
MDQQDKRAEAMTTLSHREYPKLRTVTTAVAIGEFGCFDNFLMTVMLTFAAVCGLRFLSIVVFYSRFQIYLDSDPKVNMMSLSQ